MQTLKKIKLVTYQFVRSVILDFFVFFIISSIVFFFIDKDICLWIGLFLSFTNLTSNIISTGVNNLIDRLWQLVVNLLMLLGVA